MAIPSQSNSGQDNPTTKQARKKGSSETGGDSVEQCAEIALRLDHIADWLNDVESSFAGIRREILALESLFERRAEQLNLPLHD